MASTEEKPAPESVKEVAAAPPPSSPPRANYILIDLGLRVVLFAAAVVSVVVTVTSRQTVRDGSLRGVPPGFPVRAKFNHSPAFIYFVAALSVAGLYSIITALASISVILKPAFSTKFLPYFAFLDVVILGLVASATGTAGGVAYIGLKGNNHVNWVKVCYAFDKFCQHIAGALAVSLFASFVLVLLIWVSIFNIHSRIPK